VLREVSSVYNEPARYLHGLLRTSSGVKMAQPDFRKPNALLWCAPSHGLMATCHKQRGNLVSGVPHCTVV
jgi:hypothetical protein